MGSSNPSPSAIVAFLRGINVGGHKKVPMAALKKAFGFPVTIVLRKVKELRAIVAAEPFKGAPSGPNVRRYVTFLAQKKPGLSGLRPPSSAKGVCIARIAPGEIFSVVTLSPGLGTPDLMAFLEQAIGQEVTTRNWQTVIRLAGS